MTRNGKEAASYGTLIRLLNLISLLKERKMTVEEISDHFDVSTRTAYRYVDALEVCDLVEIEQDFKRRYFVIEK